MAKDEDVFRVNSFPYTIILGMVGSIIFTTIFCSCLAFILWMILRYIKSMMKSPNAPKITFNNPLRRRTAPEVMVSQAYAQQYHQQQAPASPPAPPRSAPPARPAPHTQSVPSLSPLPSLNQTEESSVRSND